MKLEQTAIPLGLAWSSPFARWQGALAGMNSLDLAVDVTGRRLAGAGFDLGRVGGIVLGITIPQHTAFYGGPTVAARLGLAAKTGPMISQACATSAAVLQAAATQIESGAHEATLAIATDRTSNGPLLVYPSVSGAGGAPDTEHWVLDPMRQDPTTGRSMLDTGENTAADEGYTRQEIDEVTLLRYEQYRAALADDRAFQRRYMVEVHVPGRKGTSTVVSEDQGVHPTTAEGLAKLDPVTPGGVLTYGSQTHPADGTAGFVLTRADLARELGDGAGLVRVHAVAFARVEPARMPKAPVPAARAALHDAGLDISDIDLVTTHNPFAVNDLYFSRQTGYPLDRMNVYGSSLIYGHPQAPTGARAIAELIEALRERGGGRGLFTGCAAGDSAGAVVLEVTDR